MLTTTKGARLKHAMDKLGLNQEFIGSVLGVTQKAISKRIAGSTNITYEEALMLQEHPEVGIRAQWLMASEGDMLLNPQTTGEDAVIYESLKVDTSPAAITKRFIDEIKIEAERRRLSSAETAGALHLSPSHYSQLKGGKKDVTPTMLADAMLNMNVDISFILTRKPGYLGDVSKLQEKIKKLEEDNDNMRLLIATFKQKNELDEERKKERA